MCHLVEDEAHINRMIGDLLVHAGAMMEDECVTLITRLPVDRRQVIARIERLKQVATDLSALADAANVLVRDCDRLIVSPPLTGLPF